MFARLAIIELSRPIRFNSCVKPVSFKFGKRLPPEEHLFYLSHEWGVHDDDGHTKQPIMEIPVKITRLPDHDGYSYIIVERKFYLENNDTSYGEIGNHGEPLLTYDGNRDKYRLLGLSTCDIECDIKFRNVYEPVWFHLPWIKKMVKKCVMEREEGKERRTVDLHLQNQVYHINIKQSNECHQSMV
uniref:Peptidase S1 domain-containing protein n=1 Tax=Romanomermis culicivorax TaxID=13658 RepID=A0A915HKC8_ROMCU